MRRWAIGLSVGLLGLLSDQVIVRLSRLVLRWRVLEAHT